MKPTGRLRVPALTPQQRWLVIVGGGVIAVSIWLVVTSLAEPYNWATVGTGHDARPYWTALFVDPYVTSRIGAHDAYLYSPAFLQLIAPLRALPWQAFLAAWVMVLMAATLGIVGPVLFGAALLVAVPELLGGNITLLMALAIVAGFRWPSAWAFVLLTKVTPGVGLVWFAVRREWSHLLEAVFATGIVIAVSFAFSPLGIWQEWLGVLVHNAGASINSGSLPIPLLARLPLAIMLLAWGAHTNRRWVVPVACLLALPAIWYGSLTLLLAVVPLVQPARVHEHWTWSVGAARDWWAGRRTVPRQTQRA